MMESHKGTPDRSLRTGKLTQSTGRTNHRTKDKETGIAPSARANPRRVQGVHANTNLVQVDERLVLRVAVGEHGLQLADLRLGGL